MTPKLQEGEMTRDCMFQVWLVEEGIFGYYGGKTVEDTDLITFEEAVNLWEKYKPEVIKQLEDGQSPEMAIWTDCKDNIDYRNDTYHVNQDTLVENGEFIEVVKNKIIPTPATRHNNKQSATQEVDSE